MKGFYTTSQEMGVTYRSGNIQDFSGGIGPNGLTKKQELMVRSAIKYWVERHKHVVRFVIEFIKMIFLLFWGRFQIGYSYRGRLWYSTIVAYVDVNNHINAFGISSN